MEKLTLLLSLLMIFLPSSAFTQARAYEDSSGGDRIEAGVFLDYLGISQTSTNNFGLGARFGYRVYPGVMLEGDFAYDYGLNFDEAYRNVVNGNVSAIERTSIGVIQGLIGAKVQRSAGHLHPYATLKAGFADFRLSPSLLPYSNVASSVFGLRTSNLNAALYPAAGVSATVGTLGLRLEAGDEICFNRGPHHNLRITFGPDPQVLNASCNKGYPLESNEAPGLFAKIQLALRRRLSGHAHWAR